MALTDVGAVLFCCFNTFQTRLHHETIRNEPLHFIFIDGRPNAVCFLLGEKPHEFFFIQRFGRTIDPAKTERFINSFAPYEIVRTFDLFL